MNLKKFISVIIKLILLPGLIFTGLLLVNIYAYFFQKTELEPTSKFSGKMIYNPYKKCSGNLNKIAIHLHSNEVPWTLLRNSPDDIVEIYKNFGYNASIITDYFRFTDTSLLQDIYIKGYESGFNINKRHFLVLNTDYILNDFLPFFSSLENIQFKINKTVRNGGFIIIPHPELLNSFGKDGLSKLSGYQGVEVFSPYGDNPWIADSALSSGRPVNLISSEDLHYLSVALLPKRERSFFKTKLFDLFKEDMETSNTLLRYLLVDSPDLNKNNFMEKLCNGSFFAVKNVIKEERSPVIKFIGLDKESETVKIETGEKTISIDFIGQGGKILKSVLDNQIADYKFQPEDTYVRIQVLFPLKMLLTNAFYRFDGKTPDCNSVTN